MLMGKTFSTQDARQRYILLCIICVPAFFIRFMGIRFGFPLLVHPDEPQLILRGMEIIKTGDLNPHFFNYPSLYIYLQSIVYLIVQKLGVVFNVYSSIEEIPLITMVFWGRFLTVILSATTILVTYLIALNIFNSTVGIFSTLFIACSYLHITNSYLITVDSPMALWVLLSFYFSIRIYQNRSLKNYLLSGLFLGIAVGTKYNAFWGAVPIVLAHLVSSKFSFKNLLNKRLILAAVTALVAFLVSTPYALLDFQQFFSDLLYESSHYQIGHLGADEGSSYLFYISSLLDHFGTMPIFLAIVGIVLMIKYSRGVLPLLISFPLLYFIFVGYYKVHFERNIVVLIPFLSIFSGYGLWKIVSMLRKSSENVLRWSSRTFCLMLLLLAAVGLFVQARKSYTHISTITLPDTRYVSSLWVKENLPEQSKIARDHFTYLPPDGYFKDFPLGVSGLLFYNLSYFDYVITSSPNYSPLFNDKTNFPIATESYENFFKENALIKEFLPDGKTITGPEVRIYKVNPLSGFDIKQNKHNVRLRLKEIVREVQRNAFVNIDLAERYWKLGDLFKKNREIENAIAHYNLALNLKPDSKEAMEKLGLAYAMQGKYDKSLAYFRKLVLIEPEKPTHYYNMACLLSLQNKIHESIEFLRTAIEKGYRNVDQIETDEDLNNIRTSIGYQKLTQQIKYRRDMG